MDFDSPYLQERLEKANALRAAGIPPWAGAFEVTHLAAKALTEHEALAADGRSAAPVRVAGRLAAMRVQGKAGFCHIADSSGRLQLYMKQDLLGEQTYQGLVKRLDLGDWIGVEGTVFRTRTGEITVEAAKVTLLAKALLPPPDKWSGLKDVEIRYRQRYLDLLSNPEIRQDFARRSRILARLRAFLQERGFLEVETPILQTLAGGAAARPFITHHNALDMQLYLRIAPELHLKRLLVGGFDKVFEIARNFRNEGMSVKHNPEFTMIEVYEAFADGEAMLRLTEAMVADLAHNALGKSTISYQGTEIDLTPPFKRLGMAQAVREIGGVDLDSIEPAKLDRLLAEAGIDAKRRPGLSRGQRLEAIFSLLVEPKLIQPTFITDYPLEISPLAKRLEGSDDLADRFELFIYGREIANGFSELNDPIDQYQRFQQQIQARAAGDDEAHQMDEDFVTALLHGMPPAGGLGLGLDRLIMLLNDAASIRDVILFPHMRPKEGAAEAKPE